MCRVGAGAPIPGILALRCRLNPIDPLLRVTHPDARCRNHASQRSAISVRTTLPTTQTIHESLGRARALLSELIDRLQRDSPGGQAQTPASLLRMLVHVVNIQKIADQPSEDSANAIKRLRDFANTIERLDLSGESMTIAQDIRGQLIAVLRLAADQILETGAVATRAVDGETAAAS